MATYVVSDMHGQYDTFIKGLETIGFSDSDSLYVIGDAIDRGDDGIKILNHIKSCHNMDLIIGNHEFMMLNSVSSDGTLFNGEDLELWLFHNGGRTTKKQFEELKDEERKELIEWLSSRYVIKTIEVNEQKFCLTHSFFLPECENKKYSELQYQQVWAVVWKSRFRDGGTYDYGFYDEYPNYMFVTGHVPVQIAFHVGINELNGKNGLTWLKGGNSNSNLINIDGGCAKGTGEDVGMIFLRLDDMKLFCQALELASSVNGG